MSAVQPIIEMDEQEAVPRLLLELPSRPRVFVENLRALLSPGRYPALQLDSAPGEFWPDVFVRRNLPWRRFCESTVYHVVGGTLLLAFARLLAIQPHVVTTPHFEHSQVIYYSASEDLPPLDTREPATAAPERADPEFSRQAIISVPAEADNRAQTIVTPPTIKLKRDLALPNLVAWADEKQPRLAIPDAPLTPAAQIRRMPELDNAVASPPEAAKMNRRRDAPALQNSVVAPPPELRGSKAPVGYSALEPAFIAPPPSVQSSPRGVGQMDIAPSEVIAPAPQLPVAAQHRAPVGRLAAGGAAIVEPPPSVGASSSPAGSRGRIVALNLHPVVSAPAETPGGNRRATFAATPEGHAGASGSPGSAASGSSAAANSHAPQPSNNGLPSGLYVGKTVEPISTVAANANAKKPAAAVNPNLIAMARPPSLTTTSPRGGESQAKLSEAERAIFAGRRFYSLTLNMPNLNSGGGSWVIRFAEKNRQPHSDNGENISQPMAIKKVDPAYPLQLMRENVGGIVILYAVIHADGTVGDVRLLRGVDERLDRFAAEAVAKWQFQPATKDGAPVDVEATFQIPFRPTRVGTSF